MKKVILFIFLFTTIIVSTIFGYEKISVYINGERVNYSYGDANAVIISNRVYVPIRQTCEALDIFVDWDSSTNTLNFMRDGVSIKHILGTNVVYINGSSVSYDTSSINKNNRTLMPIRMLAESIGATVSWNNTTKSVYITKGNISTNNSSDFKQYEGRWKLDRFAEGVEIGGMYLPLDVTISSPNSASINVSYIYDCFENGQECKKTMSCTALRKQGSTALCYEVKGNEVLNQFDFELDNNRISVSYEGNIMFFLKKQ